MGFSIYSPPPVPSYEPLRRAAVVASGLMQRRHDPRIQQIVEFTSQMFGGIMTAATLIIDNRQILLAAQEIPAHETTRDVSICGYTILTPNSTFCVLDTLKDDRFRENPIVTDEPNIRFYLGAPIALGDDMAAGALCVFDTKPRMFVTAGEIAKLRQLASLVAEVSDVPQRLS